jgi:hypothetical protein
MPEGFKRDPASGFEKLQNIDPPKKSRRFGRLS